MFDLFGPEVPLFLKFLIAFVVVLSLIGGLAYVVRRFGSGALNSAASRGRQPRLAVIDAAPVDGRRRLVLIRRDNIEHLIMIGGPSDLVVEANIVRAAPVGTARETVPARVAGEAMPRAVAMSETNMWPLQPEPVARGQRAAPISDEPMIWPPQPQAEPAPRVSGGDRLASLASDLSRATGASAEHAAPLRPAAPESKRPAPAVAAVPQHQPPQPKQDTDDQNLAEMAHRLEAALRRPTQHAAEPAPAEPAMTKPMSEPMARPNAPSEKPIPLTARPAAPAAPAETTRAPAEPKMPKVVRPEAKPAAKSVYDSLEQEMASLLGRPSGKT